MTNKQTDERTKLRFAPFRVPRSHREKIERIGEACHIAGSRLASILLNAFLDGDLKRTDENSERRHADRRNMAQDTLMDDDTRPV